MMNLIRLSLGLSCGLWLLLLSAPAQAQTYTSGSDGSLGAFSPTGDTTVTLPPDGVLNYTTFFIPAGITVTFATNAANTPVTLLASGDVVIAGTLDVSGALGTGAATPAQGGSGGFAGGPGGTSTTSPSGGLGPGGGAPSGSGTRNATYGAPASFASLLPLFGGSGGGGGLANSLGASVSGGGGGGAIAIVSSTLIQVQSSGRITANGGPGNAASGGGQFNSGGGSGGAIRLVAPRILGDGVLEAVGGRDGFTGPQAGSGRIRLESFTLEFTGTINPRFSPGFSFSPAPGPVTAAGTPGLIDLPTLTITSVGGLTPPSPPGGDITTADVTLPGGTTNPVTVTITAANIPVSPTPAITVKVIPRSGTPSTVTATAEPGGTFEQSTYTADVTFLTGQISVLNVFSSFTLPQIASLFPLIDGEPVDRIMVAAAYGQPSTTTLITKSGRRIPAEQVLRLPRQ